MAAVIYITVDSMSTGKVASLICSGTREAPLKKLTIPRLELTAALLLAKLVAYVQATLKVKVSSTHLWTDSSVTLTWIKAHPARWKDYVRNRVSQIQELTPTAHWRHVAGTSNPADCASRGISIAQLASHQLWWSGPPWMVKPIELWPKTSTDSEDLHNMEARPGLALLAATVTPEYHWELIDRCSSLTKLCRLTSFCVRVVARMRKKLESAGNAPLTAEEIAAANVFWTRATQAVFFKHELQVLQSGSFLPSSHPFSRLTAFIDQEGGLRVGGRLAQSALTYEGRHLAILPRHSRFSTLIIDQAHVRTLHGGTQLTLAQLRLTHWIGGGRAPVKSHILHCVVCARQRGVRAQQLMGQLPLARVTPIRAFAHTGVDYAGPLTLKTSKGRGSKTHKGWICVFVCLTTSALHLEVVSDYSADGFLSVFRRFSARRGIPHTLYSDCGTNFIGAHKSIRQMFRKASQEHQIIASFLANQHIAWRFNPPAAPHMGGKWEAAVKSVKFHLRRTVGDTALTFEELATLLAQIEAILNSRPLEPLNDDPDDLSALTPGHFLIGEALTTVPEPTLENVSLSRLSRWQLLQQKVQQFWRQWSAHYLQRQQSISKWHHPNNNIKVGSLVLLTDERFPPCKWPLARVTALHPGKDGLTRVVTLRTATTTLTRPISKLAVLPVSSD